MKRPDATADGMVATIVIGEQGASWARRLLSSMPFGGIAHFRSIGKNSELTVRDVLDDFDRLREVLEEHIVSCSEAEKDLYALRSDLAAFRRVLGIPTAMQGYDAEARPVTVKS